MASGIVLLLGVNSARKGQWRLSLLVAHQACLYKMASDDSVAAPAAACDPWPVSVVLLVDNQGRFGSDLPEQVRKGTWRSAGVRRDCHPVSHSAVGSALTLNVTPLGLRFAALGDVHLCRWSTEIWTAVWHRG